MFIINVTIKSIIIYCRYFLEQDLNYDYIWVRKEIIMKPSESVKPISFFKTHASEILRDISNNHKTMVITQNGEAKAVLQDVHVYEQTQDSLALLKMLAISKKKDGRWQIQIHGTML